MQILILVTGKGQNWSPDLSKNSIISSTFMGQYFHGSSAILTFSHLKFVRRRKKTWIHVFRYSDFLLHSWWGYTRLRRSPRLRNLDVHSRCAMPNQCCNLWRFCAWAEEFLCCGFDDLIGGLRRPSSHNLLCLFRKCSKINHVIACVISVSYTDRLAFTLFCPSSFFTQTSVVLNLRITFHHIFGWIFMNFLWCWRNVSHLESGSDTCCGIKWKQMSLFQGRMIVLRVICIYRLMIVSEFSRSWYFRRWLFHLHVLKISRPYAVSCNISYVTQWTELIAYHGGSNVFFLLNFDLQTSHNLTCIT
jgi:hypothetical protein